MQPDTRLCRRTGLALAAVAALGFQQPSGRTQTLPDGTVLELCGVTSGTTHELVLGNWWQRTLGRVVQDRVPGFLPVAGNPSFVLGGPTVMGNQASFQSSRDGLVLWFRVRRKQPITMETYWGLASRSMTRDSHGCLLPCIQDGDGDSPLKESGPLLGRPVETIAVAEVPIYPRQEPQFEFGLYGHQGEEALARFTYPTPPPWRRLPGPRGVVRSPRPRAAST